MFFGNLNYLTIAISAIICMGFGFAWYSPYLFGRLWMKEMNFTPEGMEELKQKNGPAGMAKTYIVSFILTLLSALIFAVLLNSLVVTSISGLILTAFLVWLGFSMPVMANSVLYGKESYTLFAINTAYQLGNLIIIAFVVGLFS